MALFQFSKERLELEANLFCSPHSAQTRQVLGQFKVLYQLTSLELKNEACMVQLHTTGGNKKLELLSERKRSLSPRCSGDYVSKIQLFWIARRMIAMLKSPVYGENVNMQLCQCYIILVNIYCTILMHDENPRDYQRVCFKLNTISSAFFSCCVKFYLPYG